MDIMQAYMDWLNSNMWTDYFTIRKAYRSGNGFTARGDYAIFCDTWRGKHPEFGTAQSLLKELLGGQVS